MRFVDLVHGPIQFDCANIEDFVILRSDGHPTYQLSVVSDDIDMAITHVVRGDDHISNTPKQLLLYQALGAPTPRFAHVPLILGTDKKRLSKRHGATSVMEYARQGFLPEAMVNFLVHGRFFFVDRLEYDSAAVDKYMHTPGMPDHLIALDASFAELPAFDVVSTEAALRGVADARGVKAASLIHACRVAVTGKS